MESFDLGILFGIIAMFGYGLSNAMSQPPSKKLGAEKTIFFRNVFISAFLLILVLFFIRESIFSIEYIIIALGISLIGFIPLLTFLKALKVGKVGIISPISNSSVIFTIILSILFFGETLSIEQGISIGVILLGIVLVSLDFKDLKQSKLFQMSSGVPYALITCLLWGVVFFLFKIPVNVLGPILTSFIIEFGIMLHGGLYILVSKIKFEVPDKKMLVHIGLIGFFGMLGTLFFNLGISTANVSIVAALTFANPLVASIYAKIFYKEELSSQQYLAILLIVLGVVALSYF
ncbi:DMT family transporter [Candidatus Micrarchaeota archaeon]|nr:DMT family transporter [Candidatus Micrarchaeota archaeon]